MKSGITSTFVRLLEITGIRFFIKIYDCGCDQNRLKVDPSLKHLP